MEFELPPNSVAQLHELAVLFQALNRVLMDLGMLAHEGGPIHNYADVKAILFIHVHSSDSPDPRLGHLAVVQAPVHLTHPVRLRTDA